MIVATPGRLEDLLQRRAFSLGNVQILVLDEADRMLDMGFRPAVDRIVAKTPSDRQTLFFSATLDGEAGRIAEVYTHDAVLHEHTPPEAQARDIEHRFRAVDRDSRLDALVEELDDAELALVFVRTKRGADRLVKRLSGAGVDAVAMHGNKSQNQRERALDAFTTGRIRTLVATDVAARGIDVQGVSHVINFDAPDDRDSYVHRIGRTGRAGEHRHRDHLRRGRAGPRHGQDRRRPAPARRVRERRARRAADAPPAHERAPPRARRARGNSLPAELATCRLPTRRSRRPA